MYFSGVFLGENINTPGVCFVDKMAVCLRFYRHTIDIKWFFSTCLKISKVYGNGLTVFGSLSCVLFTLINSPLASIKAEIGP